MSEYFNITHWLWLADYIVPAIASAFAIWFVLLVLRTVYLIYISISMKRCKDVFTLHSLVIKPGKNFPHDPKDPKTSPQQVAKDTFSHFCHSAGIRTKSLLARHIDTIFRAGLSGGRLEVTELHKFTENGLFSINTFLKGLSSIFIIMGLFGTLFGLSQSFSKMQPALMSLKESQQTSAVADAIDALFLNLGNAFTPSIVGVGLTIVSVILFSLYLKFVCMPVKSMLNYYTINYWIPNLYPTTTQNILETLQTSEKQMHKNFESAQKVAAFADEVQTKFSDFGKQLTEASSVLSQLSTVLVNFENTSDKLNQSISGYTSQQVQAQDVYTKIHENTSHFEEYIHTGVESMTQLQSKIESSNESLNSRMGIVVESFEYFKQLNEANSMLVATAEKSFESVNKTNLEIVEGLRQPLINSMNENFTAITGAFTHELEHIVDMFARMDIPIQQSAKSISEVFGNLSKSYDNLSRLIGESVVESNQKMLTESISENKQLVKYVSALVENTAGITEFLKEQNLTGGFDKYKKRNQKGRIPLVGAITDKLFKQK